MRIRPPYYYSVQCNGKNGKPLTLDIDADTSEEVVAIICDTFHGRLEPPKDESGKFRKGQPYTHIGVVLFDKRDKAVVDITHGNVYNLSPEQVITRLRDAINS